MGRAPVEQPHRQAEIGFDHKIGVGSGGFRNGAEMDDGVEPAALQPFRQLRRRHDVREPALGEIAPFAVMAEQIANRNIGVARVVQRGHNVRSDKTGATGHQQHDIPCLDCAGPALPQSRPAGKWGGRRGDDDRAGFAAFTCREGAVTDSIEWSLAPNGQIMNINSIHKVEKDPNDTRPILIIPYMWIGDFVRGHTVVRVLKQRWPNRPVDLLVTSLCAPLVDYMPGVRNGWGSSAKPDSGCSTDGAGAKRPCPASSTRMPRWRCRTGRRCRRNGRCRSSTFPPRKPPAGGKPMGWARVPPWRWLRARSGRPSAGLIMRTPRAFWPKMAWMCGWWAAPVRRLSRQRSSPRVDLAFAT